MQKSTQSSQTRSREERGPKGVSLPQAGPKVFAGLLAHAQAQAQALLRLKIRCLGSPLRRLRERAQAHRTRTLRKIALRGGASQPVGPLFPSTPQRLV